MSSNRKVKGYIFQRNDDSYYHATLGSTLKRTDATVYSPKRIKLAMKLHAFWGRKGQGKWILVYE